MKKFIVNVFAMFIFNRDRRHKFRDYYMNTNWIWLFRKKQKYDFVFFMGEACFVAQSLKLRNVRTYSGPFDWIYSSSFETRMNIFINKFKNYLDHGDFEYVSPGVEHVVYKNKKTGLIYNHDFDEPFDESYPLVYEKYQRRIKRLMDVLKQPNTRVCIVYCETMTAQPVRDDVIAELLAHANKTYDNKIDLVYFAHNPYAKIGSVKLYKQAPHLKIFSYHGSYNGPERLRVSDHEISHNEKKIKQSISKALSYIAPRQ